MTIEEMALIDLPVKIADNGSNDLDENEVLRPFYILGANAVLEEIEKVFTADYPSIFMATQAMRDKINELKGKEK